MTQHWLFFAVGLLYIPQNVLPLFASWNSFSNMTEAYHLRENPPVLKTIIPHVGIGDNKKSINFASWYGGIGSHAHTFPLSMLSNEA